jgi:drug/metabolite transporter (DMT)-like permease
VSGIARGAAESSSADYRFGVLCIVAAAFFTSLAGILLRWMEAAGGWQILFYRSLAFVAAMLVFIALRHRGRTARAFLEIGKPGLVAALCLGAAFMLFVFALLKTSVANVVFTVSLSPFFAALFAWVALREAVRPATLVTMGLALAGVGFMIGDSLAAGSLDGNLLALVTCLCYSVAIVALRGGRRVDMIPAVCLAGVIAAAISGLMAEDLHISRHDLMLAVTLGVVQLAFQYMLLTTGTRYVPAAEVPLIGRLSLVMAPLWVWIGVGEVPGGLTLIGGAIVLAAICGHGLLTLRAARRRTA